MRCDVSQPSTPPTAGKPSSRSHGRGRGRRGDQLSGVAALHLDRSEPRFSGGIDWRARFAAMRMPGRIAFAETADSSPLLAASDVMVTDHSSIGFEFCLLDRPLIVFDAPDLAEVARIDPEKIRLLRSAARVVKTAADVGPTALAELQDRTALAERRRALAREMFYEPGTATERAVALVYALLDRPAPQLGDLSARHPHPAAMSL